MTYNCTSYKAYMLPPNCDHYLYYCQQALNNCHQALGYIKYLQL